MRTDPSYIPSLETLKAALEGEPLLELAVLIGSRATGRAGPASDWDIAIQWERGVSFLERVGRTETLRRWLAALLGVTEDAIDLIDLPAARLAMRAVARQSSFSRQQESRFRSRHIDSFHALADLGLIEAGSLAAWNAAIGLRNRIVHDYMNVDMTRVLELVRKEQFRFVTEFLMAPVQGMSDKA